MPFKTLPGLLTCVSLLSCTTSSPSHHTHAFCNLARSANPSEFHFLHRKFAEPPCSCLLQPCQVSYPVLAYFPAPQVRRPGSLVPLATLSGLLTRSSFLSCIASSPSHLARASCNLAGSANPCELTFLHSKFIEPPRSCPLQPCRPGLLTRASFISCTASSPSHLACASCNLARSANPSEFHFLHRKFAEPPRLCLLQPSQPGLLTRASFISCTASSPSHLACASCNLARSANPSEFHFLHRKYTEAPRSCLLQPCRVSYPVRDYFPAPQVRRAASLVRLATLSGLLTCASLLCCAASSPSHLARASCNLAGSANPCEFTLLRRKFAKPPRSCLLQSCQLTFLHRKFAEPPCSCPLQPCRVSYPVRDYFPAPQVRRATTLVPFATLPGLLTRATFISCTASSPSHLARAPCNLAGSANPSDFHFLHRKFAEPPCSCPLQPCRVSYPVRDYFPAPQVRRATTLVPFATLPGLLTRATFISCTASSPSHLARAPCNLAGSANPSDFHFLHRKFAEPPCSCPLQPCRVSYPVRDYFPAPQVRRATTLVPFATLPGLLTRATFISCTASSPSHLARAPCNLAGSANPSDFHFLHRKFAEPPCSCPLQPCRVSYPVRDYFPAPQVRRATTLVPFATLPGLLTRATFISCTASSPSHLARAPCNLAGSANPSDFHFLHRKFAEPPCSCPLQPCRVSYPVRDYFPAPQVRRATTLVPFATLPGLLTRATFISCTASSPSHLARAPCNLAGSANPSDFHFLHRKFAEPPCSCPLQPCRVSYPVRDYFPAPQVRRATTLVPFATLPGLLTRATFISCTASSPSHLARAPCNLAGSANPSDFHFLHRKFAEPPCSCPLQPCRVSYPVRDYFPAPQVRRATTLVPFATLPGLLTRATFISCTASSPSHLARAPCNLAGSANPSDFHFLHRKFAEPPCSCPLQPCRVSYPVRDYFPAPQVRRATTLVPFATLPGLLTRATFISCTASSPSHLVRASCNLAGSSNPCELTFPHRKFAEPPHSCLLQPCRVC
ncbi:hypothetical protein CRG98_045241 [Punica granatum]|uniref:Uncharacterized protein n=1 Tax=Punica granatum TaxID=22663 RepID=A0A2I0HRL6_PUNGR|nr:hypothetical protein CRG98_045241 [Punica granatum]